MNASIPLPDEGKVAEMAHPCVLCFNSNDPSGAGGLTADILAMSSVGAHVLAIATGTYVRDTAETFDHVAFDEETIDEQARSILEDVAVQVIKVGFCGTPDILSTIAELCTDYASVPVVAYMPSLSWWQDDPIEAYQDAFLELLLPQTTVLVGNHSTLWRWLLPDWGSDRSPTARDLAKAAAEKGVPYTLVTGMPQQGGQHVENALATPLTVLVSETIERFDAVFTGAGDTLSAALAGLLAMGDDLEASVGEALGYLDGSLDGGFRPGMGHAVADRLFWAQSVEESGDADTNDSAATADDFSLPGHHTRH
jgi:hydroxymethylpyrimidine/phosphomethylpyrimidine kinase